MLIDLSISADLPQSDIAKIISQHQLFGYDAVCIDTPFKPTAKAQLPTPHSIVQPLPISSFYQAQADSLHPHPVKIYSRITISLESRNHLHFFNTASSGLRKFDIVAVEPRTEDAFRLACGDLEVDVISLDFSQRLPFFIKHTQVKLALSRGICFEIKYYPLLFDSDSSYSQPRIQFTANVGSLLSISKGKHCFFSSGARDPFDLRAPADVVNLSSIFGLDPGKGKKMVYDWPFLL
ncbi:hypothetical protein GEMRC1_011403 [Eukaryota sp. GEM-RC1]